MTTPPESFIQYLWMNKKITPFGLKTKQGQSIQILNYGQLNTIAGPDIFNARIKIGETLWNGNVEFHVSSSDWYKHGHENDSSYDNVILHVVLNDDSPVLINGLQIETIVVPPSLVKSNLKNLNSKLSQFSSGELPCKELLVEVPEIYKESWKTRLMSERIEMKLKEVQSKPDVFNFSWSLIMTAFGVKHNKVPMQQMANQIDFREINEFSKIELDNYFMKLSQMILPISINDQNLMQTEIQCDSNLDQDIQWKFGGIRPVNQPIIKLMQFSSFFYLLKNKLIDLLLELSFEKIIKELHRVEIHPYWETHTSFDKKCKPRKLAIGKTFENHLKLNALYPLAFTLNKNLQKEDVSSDIIQLYEKAPKENNRITRFMMESGFANQNGFDSQSLIHLNQFYCQRKNCLNCAIGIKIIE